MSLQEQEDACLQRPFGRDHDENPEEDQSRQAHHPGENVSLDQVARSHVILMFHNSNALLFNTKYKRTTENRLIFLVNSKRQVVFCTETDFNQFIVFVLLES